ncbi:MAG: hypothetical protein Fur0014_02850 [Rubrivivax sp.]
MRCASAGPGTRQARAISAVLRRREQRVLCAVLGPVQVAHQAHQAYQANQAHQAHEATGDAAGLGAPDGLDRARRFRQVARGSLQLIIQRVP